MNEVIKKKIPWEFFVILIVVFISILSEKILPMLISSLFLTFYLVKYIMAPDVVFKDREILFIHGWGIKTTKIKATEIFKLKVLYQINLKKVQVELEKKHKKY